MKVEIGVTILFFALKTVKLGDVEECFTGLGHDCVVDCGGDCALYMLTDV